MDSITISLSRLVGNMFGFSGSEQDNLNPWSYARVLAERLRPEPPKPRRYVQASEVVYPGTTDGKLELAVNEMTVCKEIFDKWGASMDEYASSSSYACENVNFRPGQSYKEAIRTGKKYTTTSQLAAR
jgi:hypothetical protein